MKIRLITCLFLVLLIGGNLKSSPVEKLDAYFEGNDHECYYWYKLHHPDAPVVLESDLVSILSDETEQNGGNRISSRDISAALFLARDQEAKISPDLLLRELVALTVEEGHNRELQLITELSLTLASQGAEARDAMFSLRHSADEVVANAIISALSVYGGEEIREKMHDEITLARKYDRERFKTRDINFEFDPFPNLTASHQLGSYLDVKERDLNDSEILNTIGELDAIKVSSTANHPNEKAAGAYLSIYLNNVYWLSRLREAFSNASSPRERAQMEKIVRDAFNRNHSPKYVSISYRAKIYYLLGFELNKAEKEYLTDVLGLEEAEFLPRGEIHLMGFNLDDFQRSDDRKLVATPEPEDLITLIAEVASEEPTEKPAEVAPVAEPSTDTAEKSSQWWLWLIGAVVFAGVFGLILRRKS